MSETLSDRALCSVQDVADALGMTLEVDDPREDRLIRLINAASEEIYTFTGREFIALTVFDDDPVPTSSTRFIKEVTVDVPYNATNLYTTGHVVYTPDEVGERLLDESGVIVTTGFNTTNANGAKARFYTGSDASQWILNADIGGVDDENYGDFGRVQSLASNVDGVGGDGFGFVFGTLSPLKVYVIAGDESDPNTPTAITEGAFTVRLLVSALPTLRPTGSGSLTDRTFDTILGNARNWFLMEVGDMATAPTSLTINDLAGNELATITDGIDVFPRVRQDYEPITHIRVKGHSLWPGQSVTITSNWGFPALPQSVRMDCIETVRLWWDQISVHSATVETEITAGQPTRLLPPHVVTSLNQWRIPRG